MTAGSAPATARNTTPPAASGRGRRPPISPCLPTSSFPTARSASADPLKSSSRIEENERAFDVSAAERIPEVVRGAPADRRADPFLLRRLSDAAEPELLVDVRRDPLVHARRADRHRHHPDDALHAACRYGVQFRRAHHARRELRLAVALPPLQRRVDVLRRRLHPHVPRAL